MEKEKIEGNFSQKRTIMVFVILLCLLFTSIGIFIGYKLGNNDADVNTSNNENTNNDDNIENNNNIDEEINNDFDENDIIEVKNKLKDDIDIYMYLHSLIFLYCKSYDLHDLHDLPALISPTHNHF